jgi:hypothetical protein
MMTWLVSELSTIVEADDLKIAPFRDDGKTYGTPTSIWCVVVDGDLYVRAYNGQKSRWYGAAMKQRAGRIVAAGMTRDVTFESANDAINDRVDDAYKAKYQTSRYLKPMIGASARSATVKVIATKRGCRP